MSENENEQSLDIKGMSNEEIAMIYNILTDFFDSSIKALKEANIARRKNCLMVQMMLTAAEAKMDGLSEESKRLLDQLKADTEKVFGYELEIPKHHKHYDIVKGILAKMKGLAEDIYEAEPEVKEFVSQRTIDDDPEAVQALQELLEKLKESLDRDKLN